VGYENYKVREIAEMVAKTIDPSLPIKTTPTDDNRSYRVSSKKVKAELGYAPKRSVEDAILDLKRAFDEGKIPDPLNDIRYYNIKTMQTVKLK
jgi:nucleoside-diphosphate-sugar epimerase